MRTPPLPHLLLHPALLLAGGGVCGKDEARQK